MNFYFYLDGNAKAVTFFGTYECVICWLFSYLYSFKSLLFLYRLPVLLVRSKMAENLKSATQLIEQGHVRVGTDIVKDPAFLVTRNLEDFVTWVDTSAIKRHVMDYKDIRDDFDINC